MSEMNFTLNGAELEIEIAKTVLEEEKEMQLSSPPRNFVRPLVPEGTPVPIVPTNVTVQHSDIDDDEFEALKKVWIANVTRIVMESGGWMYHRARASVATPNRTQ